MTEIANLGGKALHEVLISAANSLENNKNKINDLNVFPVPDGDTGTNMGLTIGAVREISLANDTVSDCAAKAASAVLRSARGNSGAILALFFRGFSKAVKDLDTADADAMVTAFALGRDEAYKAVMNPAEGTILTVIRRCAEDAPAHKDTCGGDLVKFFTAILNTAEKTLEQTPEMLPILKEAHVVDAGGAGFVMILRGMLAALRGTPVASTSQSSESTNAKAEFSDFNTDDIKFSYCTEFIVEKSEAYLGEGTASALYERIEDIGDSIVFVDAEDIVKVHIHTNHPGAVLEAALLFGMFATVKIENMKKQHSSLADTAATPTVDTVATPTKKYGFVSVCMGDGIRDMFRDFNVDEIVFGGQTMNPSMQDILDAVNKTPSEIVYVLPNNKNIDMVAMQAAEVSTEKNVIVIHTKSVPEGISALLSFDENVTPDENTEAMSEAISLVKSISVTHAVRDACIDGIAVRSGQAMGMLGGKIRTVGNTSAEAVQKMLHLMKDASYITIFYGEDVSEWEAGKVENMIKETAADAEVVLARGGQPLYDYIISVE